MTNYKPLAETLISLFTHRTQVDAKSTPAVSDKVTKEFGGIHSLMTGSSGNTLILFGHDGDSLISFNSDQVVLTSMNMLQPPVMLDYTASEGNKPLVIEGFDTITDTNGNIVPESSLGSPNKGTATIDFKALVEELKPIYTELRKGL